MQGRRWVDVDAEQGLGVTDKARAVAVDARFGNDEQRLLIETAGENGFDGAIEDAVVSERAGAGGFQTRRAIPLSESQHCLRGAQTLDDAIGEQPFDEGGAGGAMRVACRRHQSRSWAKKACASGGRCSRTVQR